jgi:hypothetical protein
MPASLDGELAQFGRHLAARIAGVHLALRLEEHHRSLLLGLRTVLNATRDDVNVSGPAAVRRRRVAG